MATKKEIMLQLLKGVSWNDTARSLGKGVRTFLWTGYAASPRLLRYCIGLIQPSPSFGRPSL